MRKVVIMTRAGPVRFIDHAGSGWMAESDWYKWYNYTNARKYKLAFNKKALSIIQSNKISNLGEDPVFDDPRKIEEEFKIRSEAIKKEYQSKTPYIVKRSQEIVVNVPSIGQAKLIDEHSSGWMREGDWHNWYDLRRRSESRANDRKPGYNQVAMNILAEADAIQKKLNIELSQKMKEIEEWAQEQIRVINENKIRAEEAAKVAAQLEESKKQAMLKAEQEARSAQLSLNLSDEETAALKEDIYQKLLQGRESQIQEIIASRKEPIAKANSLLSQSEKDLAALPTQPSVRFGINTGTRRTVEYYDKNNKLTKSVTLVNETSSGWMYEEDWPQWNEYRRKGESDRRDRFAINAKSRANNLLVDKIAAEKEFNINIQPKIDAIKNKITHLKSLKRLLEQPRILSDTEKVELQKTLDIALQPLPERKQIIIVDEPDHKIMDLPSGRWEFRNEHDSGWMTQGDWNNWWSMVRNGEHRRAKRHQVGYNAKAAELMAGHSIEVAEESGKNYYESEKHKQEEEAKKSGIKKLMADTEEFLKKNGGKLMMAVGAVATLIPVVGWIVGPVLAAGGKILDEKQQADWAARLAKLKEKELTALKDQFDNGLLSEEEYESKVKAVLEEGARELVAEDKAKEAEEAAKKAQEPTKTTTDNRWAIQDESKFGIKKAGIGIAAGAGIIGISVAAILMLRRKKKSAKYAL